MKKAIAIFFMAALAVGVEYTPPVAPTFTFALKSIFFTADDSGWPRGGYADIKKKTVIGGQVIDTSVQRIELPEGLWLELLNRPVVLAVGGVVVTQRYADVLGAAVDSIARADNPYLTGSFADAIPYPVTVVSTSVYEQIGGTNTVAITNVSVSTEYRL